MTDWMHIGIYISPAIDENKQREILKWIEEKFDLHSNMDFFDWRNREGTIRMDIAPTLPPSD